MISKRTLRPLALAAAFTAYFFASATALNATGRLIQLGTLSSLLEGVYQGTMPMETLQRPDSYGLGTFNHLDGEMVVINGLVYRVGFDGKVTKPGINSMVPFACVSVMQEPDVEEDISSIASMGDLKEYITGKLQSVNYPSLIVIEGDFDMVKTRSVPAQQKPYPTLIEVVKDQAVFELGPQSGTVVCFYCPPAFSGLNAAGFHFHFLNSEREAGGHVLDLSVAKATMKIQTLTSFQLILPPVDSDFAISDLAPDEPVEHVKGE